MTTFVSFLYPPRNTTFKFQPTLDGVQYAATIIWNLFAQRYYMQLLDMSGNLICNTPVRGTEDELPLASASWDDASQLVTLTTQSPHNIMTGGCAKLTVSNMNPETYNGLWSMYSLTPDTLQYPMTTDPGDAVSLGTVCLYVNLVGGYFQTSSLIYRTSSSNFEINP